MDALSWATAAPNSMTRPPATATNTNTRWQRRYQRLSSQRVTAPLSVTEDRRPRITAADRPVCAGPYPHRANPEAEPIDGSGGPRRSENAEAYQGFLTHCAITPARWTAHNIESFQPSPQWHAVHNRRSVAHD
jgi:hypothetical protein